jgi:predicted GIY-YIG superfamily endonuclease
MQTAKRKKRSDRMHIIYQLTAPNGEFYIGVTHREGTATKSLVRRWRKHVGRAFNQAHDWKLCVAIRQYGADAFEQRVLEQVRGKAPAHQRERQLVRLLKPTLNTDVRARASAENSCAGPCVHV